MGRSRVPEKVFGAVNQAANQTTSFMANSNSVE
jgi:hypothetical protein